MTKKKPPAVDECHEFLLQKQQSLLEKILFAMPTVNFASFLISS